VRITIIETIAKSNGYSFHDIMKRYNRQKKEIKEIIHKISINMYNFKQKKYGQNSLILTNALEYSPKFFGTLILKLITWSAIL
jgi:hypothetical protein